MGIAQPRQRPFVSLMFLDSAELELIGRTEQVGNVAQGRVWECQLPNVAAQESLYQTLKDMAPLDVFYFVGQNGGEFIRGIGFLNQSVMDEYLTGQGGEGVHYARPGARLAGDG